MDKYGLELVAIVVKKINDSMHLVNVALAREAPHYVTRVLCSCTAGKSGMCSHVVGLLMQVIHYALMKVKAVPVDLTCTQMQQACTNLDCHRLRLNL